MDHWDYSDLNKTFAINSYVTVVKRRGDIFKDGFNIHLRRHLRRGISSHHRTQLSAFLEVSNDLMVVVDGYFSNFNRLFICSLLTVLTQRRRFFRDYPSVSFQVKLLQLLVEIKEVPIDLVDFDHRFACVS